MIIHIILMSNEVAIVYLRKNSIKSIFIFSIGGILNISFYFGRIKIDYKHGPINHRSSAKNTKK